MKQLHIQSLIIFDNPCVVRVEHHGDHGAAHMSYRTTIKNTRNKITSTWGYSQLIIGQVDPNQFADISFINRSFWCFADELDAMQFILTEGNNAHRCWMWPSACKFTIYEIT